MNKTKSSNPVRLIAFFLTAFLLLCTFGFTADGWQTGNLSGSTSGEHTPPNESEDNTAVDEENQEENTKAPEIYIPKYFNRITGVETTEEIAAMAHLAFVLNPSSACYGISSADMICEIPTENGERLLAFIPYSSKMWKIGPITNTRGYISNLAKFFDGICISDSPDDEISYNQCDVKDRYIDLSESDNYHYTEFTENLYTNSDLISLAINSVGINLTRSEPITLPYVFADYNSEPVFYGDNNISKVVIKRSNNSASEYLYNAETGQYTITQNGSMISDAINGKIVTFENCFILFSDSVIYDNAQCSQMVMDTIGTGSGYYFTRGGVCEINWSSTEDGKIKFTLSDGNDLIINRGSIYLSFLRSSTKEKIVFQ